MRRSAGCAPVYNKSGARLRYFGCSRRVSPAAAAGTGARFAAASRQPLARRIRASALRQRPRGREKLFRLFKSRGCITDKLFRAVTERGGCFGAEALREHKQSRAALIGAQKYPLITGSENCALVFFGNGF